MFSLLSRAVSGGGAAGPSPPAASASANAAAASPAAAAAVEAVIAARRAVYPRDMQRGAAVPRAKLERMLDAARWAPTHKLTQPWRFVVLGGQQKEAFEALTIELVEKNTADPEKREATLKKMHRKRGSDWKNVALYVAIVLRRTQGPSAPPEWEEQASVAMAVQNLWLAGWAEGVHGYWSSWQPPARDAPEMAAFLGADLGAGDRVMGFFVCGVGDPERLASYKGSRKPVADVVEWRLE